MKKIGMTKVMEKLAEEKCGLGEGTHYACDCQLRLIQEYRKALKIIKKMADECVSWEDIYNECEEALK